MTRIDFIGFLFISLSLPLISIAFSMRRSSLMMSAVDRCDAMKNIMTDFARNTGLESGGSDPKRYLWTDAFAVCNYLELHRQTGETQYVDKAAQLIEQVHNVLGKHRPDDSRTGWISGLSGDEVLKHPTYGGLRIGKKQPERKQDEPRNNKIEWDQDGQYFHYDTKWMHALERMAMVTHDATYLRWAMEMAKMVFPRFCYRISRGTQRSLFWKMSIDLSYPLIRSPRQHDPLDGYVTYRELKAASWALNLVDAPNLDSEIDGLYKLSEGKSVMTNETLSLGGLLCDAYRVAQLPRDKNGPKSLLRDLLAAAAPGVQQIGENKPFQNSPANRRLPFRELGLSIGLKAMDSLVPLLKEHPEIAGTNFVNEGAKKLLKRITAYSQLSIAIDEFWANPANQKGVSWTEHKDINMAMLATSMAPQTFLTLQ